MNDHLQRPTISSNDYTTGEVSEEKFYEQIELGNNFRTMGNLDESLKYFEAALDNSMFLKNKVFQVDALCNISDIYFEKGELPTATSYTDRADEILQYIDYTKGNLEVSLDRIGVSYVKHEYYKVREIGNEAIKLCGETLSYI